MASLIDDLIDVIEEETQCYRLLLDMANNKKDVIIKGDLPSLQEMTKQEQELAGLLLRLEKKRAGTLDDICLVTNREKEAMNASMLIGMLEGQEKEQRAMKEAIEALNEVIMPLKEANELNGRLIQQSLEFVDFTMNAVSSGREPVMTNNYKSKGTAYEPGRGNTFFDAKQ